MNEADIVVVGSCNVDLISYVERFPKAGETICGSRFEMGCGGKGANQCVMAAKLGAKTAMVACLGNDNFGAMYQKNFSTLNIDTSNVHVIPNTTTGVAPITVNTEGENSIVIVKGANDCLSKEHLQEALGVIRNSKLVLCQLEVDLDVTLAALKLAHENKVKTIFNPAPAVTNLSPDFLKYTTILCCNETEAEILTGSTVSTLTECKQTVKQLLRMGPQCVVLTLGEKGAMFAECGSDYKVQHVRTDDNTVQSVVDTTGAGDCFVGSLAYFMCVKPELSLREKISRAVKIASISVCKPGTQTSYPPYDDLPEELKN